MSISTFFINSLFYWISFVALIPFLIYYYKNTIKKDSDIFWFIHENGVRKFDFEFLKKMATRIAQVYLTFITFFNVGFFVFDGKWYDEGSFQASKSFVMIGAISYIIDMIAKSSNLVHEHRQKKIKVGGKSTKLK